jgi:hypothetical protein
MPLARISGLLAFVVVTALRVSPVARAGGFPEFVVPDVPDLTIKTRRTIDHPSSTIVTEIVNLKGAWQRREQVFDFPAIIPTAHTQKHVAITRCDERRTLELNEESRTYASTAIEDVAAHERRLRLAAGRGPQAVLIGTEVKITVDAVDTGERRQIGRHAARHVITTTTTTPSPGANTRASERVQDGWYIDVPPSECWDWGEHTSALSTYFVRAGTVPDRVHVEWRGAGRRGFPVEEISRSSSDAGQPTARVTLLDFSEAALDAALFTVPPGYRPALPRLTGGFDMSKPDTMTNRLQSYWQELTSWAQSVLRCPLC